MKKLKLFIYQKLLFPLGQLRKRLKCEWWLLRTLIQKECYVSPFFGEFGHLLGHYVPLAAYLHKKGVKVHFCGLTTHKPFFVDEQGNSTIHKFLEVRDFFNESKPFGNQVKEPEDVAKITADFVAEAAKSRYTFWDLRNFDFYFYYWRWWAVNTRRYHCYNMGKAYKANAIKKNQVVVFPRKSTLKKGGKALFCNGHDWEYERLINQIADTGIDVQVIGHPSFSQDLNVNRPNVYFNVSGKNIDILKICAESKLIISQHSGASYLGAYTHTQVVMIYLGGNKVGEIEMTEAFNDALNEKFSFDFAYSYEQVVEKVVQYAPLKPSAEVLPDNKLYST